MYETSPGPLGADGRAPNRHRLEFTASGSEYFRIWIVNLLLMVVTLGLYLPWAKVRKLKYFYSNTWVDGDALDFHGEPGKMLRGTLIAGAMLIVFSLASNISPAAAAVAGVAFVALWPLLFRASMRFRLANTSWRGLRFHFAGSTAGAYGAVMPPMILALVVLLLPLMLVDTDAAAGALRTPPAMSPTAAGLMGLSITLFVLAVPYFLWRVKRYQHGNYVWGSLQTELRTGPGSFYWIVLKLVGMLVTAGVVFVLFSVLIGAGTGLGRRQGLGVAAVLLVVAVVLVFNVLPKTYLQVRLQNLLWTRTGNGTVRFRSDLSLPGYFGLQLKNYLLIFLTLGLYWPFAVVHSRRAQLEAVELHTRVPLDRITQTATRENPGATGDMAADLFGVDIGL